ncbi:MAG TPA: hypothetical protein VJV78_40925 [Polyangiales bacterium]|nr:hypothetical protein [Polyangiales bacterium]
MSTAKLGLCLIAVSLMACTESDTLGKVTHLDASTDEDASTPALRYWVGTVEDSDIRLGVAQEPERARVFFCGGPSSYATATRWVVTTLAADGGFEFEDEGWRVSGQLSDDEIAGTLRLGSDESRDFSASPVRKGTIAGLYEGTADCGRVGLIVSQADKREEPTGQGACVGAGHPPEQVNPILPIALSGGEIRVEIGDAESSVRPAGPPP